MIISIHFFAHNWCESYLVPLILLGNKDQQAYSSIDPNLIIDFTFITRSDFQELYMTAIITRIICDPHTYVIH